jgi:hypothetical protein
VSHSPVIGARVDAICVFVHPLNPVHATTGAGVGEKLTSGQILNPGRCFCCRARQDPQKFLWRDTQAQRSLFTS